jgi:hypothetical protein
VFGAAAVSAARIGGSRRFTVARRRAGRPLAYLIDPRFPSSGKEGLFMLRYTPKPVS